MRGDENTVPRCLLVLLLLGCGDSAGGGSEAPDPAPTGGATPDSGTATPDAAARDAGPPIEPVASPCDPDPARRPEGSGALGCWFEDQDGLPAYAYTAQPGDAPYFTRREGENGSTDHWHQVGNDRIVATAHGDGRMRLFDGTRGGKWVSEYGVGQVKNLSDGLDAPAVAESRTFGVGYFETASQVGSLRTTRRVFAPFGDVAGLVVVHTLENRGDAPIGVEVGELWDAAMYPLTLSLTYATAPGVADDQRALLMRKFEQRARFEPARSRVVVETRYRADAQPPAPPRAEAADADYWPGALSLTLIDGPIAAFALEHRDPCAEAMGECERPRLAVVGGATTRVQPPAEVVDGDPNAPEAAPVPAYPGARLTHLRTRRLLEPGQTVQVRFVVAYDAGEGPDSAFTPAADDPALDPSATSRQWRDSLLDLRAEGAPHADTLRRELLWHGSMLRGALVYDAFHGKHNLDQGSAYGYLQGLRGASRDSLINAVGLLPLSPTLAREQIEYVLQTATEEKAQLSYGTSGYGRNEAATIHTRPSDLDLWLLWAVDEYVGLTRDFAWLDAPVAYWPPGAGRTATVRERLGRSLDWLENEIGVGEHGLLKVGSGDWSDGISFLASDRRAFTEAGESVFNTALAAYVMPRVAAWLTPRDAALGARFERAGAGFRSALGAQFNGRWYNRAWDGSGQPIGQDRMFLEHHVWTLIGDVPDAAQRATVHAALESELQQGSRIGTLIVYPPIDNQFLHPGWDVNGGAWAAMNGLLVWGLSRSDPDRAWSEFVSNSMMRHAETYPNLWYGIWSGPDAYNAEWADRPGETFFHVATPMTDFPVMNSNRHALPLLDAMKLAGVEPTAEGLRFESRVPGEAVSLTTPTVRWSTRADAVEVEVDFREAGRLDLALPSAWGAPARVLVAVGETAPALLATQAGRLSLDVPAGRTRVRVTRE